jgi:hypothetical protein
MRVLRGLQAIDSFVWIFILNTGSLWENLWLLFWDLSYSRYNILLAIKFDHLGEVEMDCFLIVLEITHWIRPVA